MNRIIPLDLFEKIYTAYLSYDKMYNYTAYLSFDKMYNLHHLGNLIIIFRVNSLIRKEIASSQEFVLILALNLMTCFNHGSEFKQFLSKRTFRNIPKEIWSILFSFTHFLPFLRLKRN